MKTTLLTSLALSAAILVGCQEGATTTAPATASENTVTSTVTVSNGSIAYVNTDSLVFNYDYYIEQKAKFDTKAAGVQKQLETKTQSLERKVTDYQNKVSKSLITRSQAAETEEKLTAEQQTLIKYRDEALAELQEEEQVLFNNINNDIFNFLTKYNEEKGYDLILNTNSATTTVLIGNPSLNITQEVIKGLNKEYSANRTTSAQ